MKLFAILKTPTAAACLAVLLCCCLVLSVASTSFAQDGSLPPAWQMGQSNWNGQGYDNLPMPETPPSLAYPENLSPPVDYGVIPVQAVSTGTGVPVTPAGYPNFKELPSDWGGEFGLSPVQLEPPVLDGAAIRSPAMTPQPESQSDLPIGSAVQSGEVIEAPPLEEEVVSWYQVPWRWMTRGWKNHAEFGLDGSSGNADTLAIQTGLEMKRKTDRYTLALDFDYRQANANDQITEENGRFNLDYDRLLGDSAWTMFGKFGMEFDQFKSFDLRLNMNGGIGYYWIRNDTTNLVTRFGAGASREIGAPIDKWTPEAVFGIEADHQLTSRQKVKAKLDYFPAWEDFADFRLVTDVAWETLLDSSDNLSLRLSLTDRYDSTPQGALKNDFYYSALLLYKF